MTKLYVDRQSETRQKSCTLEEHWFIGGKLVSEHYIRKSPEHPLSYDQFIPTQNCDIGNSPWTSLLRWSEPPPHSCCCYHCAAPYLLQHPKLHLNVSLSSKTESFVAYDLIRSRGCGIAWWDAARGDSVHCAWGGINHQYSDITFEGLVHRLGSTPSDIFWRLRNQ